MGKRKKEITAVIVPPENKDAKQKLQKIITACYIARVKRKIEGLPITQQLSIVDALIAYTSPSG